MHWQADSLPLSHQGSPGNSNTIIVRDSISTSRDFPGGPVVKSTPCNAENTGWILGWDTKVTHAMEQLRLHAAATEPMHSEAHAPQLESPRDTTKILHAATKTQCTQINTFKNTHFQK